MNYSGLNLHISSLECRCSGLRVKSTFRPLTQAMPEISTLAPLRNLTSEGAGYQDYSGAQRTGQLPSFDSRYTTVINPAKPHKYPNK